MFPVLPSYAAVSCVQIGRKMLPFREFFNESDFIQFAFLNLIFYVHQNFRQKIQLSNFLRKTACKNLKKLGRDYFLIDIC